MGLEQLCERGLFCIKTFLGHNLQPLTNASGVTLHKAPVPRHKCSQLQSSLVLDPIAQTDLLDQQCQCSAMAGSSQ